MNHELDGKLDSFGARMLALIDKQYPLSVQIKKDPITAVVYTDRYLKSPLTLLILDSVIKELYHQLGKPIKIVNIYGMTGKIVTCNKKYLNNGFLITLIRFQLILSRVSYSMQEY